jgi:hypothetical protein
VNKTTRVLAAVWLTLSLCYVAFLLLEYKNSFDVSGPEQKLQRIEESTDIVQLKRTSKMYVDFMYGVHFASLRLWVVNVGYGVINTAFLAYCVCFGRGLSVGDSSHLHVKPSRDDDERR